jgi:methionyl-tRNA formyltransferase
MHRGAQLVLKTVKAIEANNYPSIPQEENIEIKHAPKIFKETCEINWNQPTRSIINFVRGLTPYPSAWTRLNQKTFKIFKVSPVTNNSNKAIVTNNKSFLHIKTADGFIAIEELQPEGKKRMTIEDFFRGNKLD